jgi:hypothetical protein
MAAADCGISEQQKFFDKRPSEIALLNARERSANV